MLPQADHDPQIGDDASSSAEYGAALGSEEDDEATLEEEEVGVVLPDKTFMHANDHMS